MSLLEYILTMTTMMKYQYPEIFKLFNEQEAMTVLLNSGAVESYVVMTTKYLFDGI